MAVAVALATYRPRPDIVTDRDLPRLVRALGEAGATARAEYWDDPDADWGAYDLVLIRSTWDYIERVAEFTAWADRVAGLTVLANPADVVRWNTDKRYLGDLAAAGVPTVPTAYVAPGEDPEGALPDREFVIKPTVGAGSRLAARHRPGEHGTARAHLARLGTAGLTAVVQPYMPRIDTTGERALIFFGGSHLHAIRKGPVLTPGIAYDAARTAHPDVRVWQATDAELAVAERALAAVPGAAEPLYARVDLVDGDDGAPCVMELELIEPNLFLAEHPGSLTTVAELIVKAAG
ncbi:ATP-grasp domain-containing protein [Streptomyces longispororuber]|uniref:ATP-grasp domain-containing protein n=1 Tax=Streptomyces longispororuber TaxID=68230 RepID=A0A918ZTR2_9ACTN|nr:hypothetical protein [Streptomyces longispororuber]GHE69953.1 ATP-grasp domain-containing protein [Streptomyces longispororuber]